MGQGAPEVGDLPDGPPRIRHIDLSQWGDSVNEYASTTGIKELRQAVADYYNREYRQGMKSQYTYENICITPGGRAGMARVAAVIGEVYTGYQIPEYVLLRHWRSRSSPGSDSIRAESFLLPRYTTYSEVLSVFKNLVPVPSALSAEDKYKLHIETLKKEMEDMSLSVIVASNRKFSRYLQIKQKLRCLVVFSARNPTGQAIVGDDLEELVQLSRDKVTLIMDEFYSW